MKKVFLYILITLQFALAAAQSGPMAKPGSTGIWIVFSEPAGAGNSYEISPSGEKRESVAAVLLPPVSRAEMDARIAEINRPEMNLGEMPRQNQLDGLWRLLARNAPADSFAPVRNSYAALYACGMAWFDGEAEKETPVKYKIVRKSAAGSTMQEWNTDNVKWPGKGPQMKFSLVKVQSIASGNTFDMTAEFPKELSHFKVFRSYHLRSGFEPISARVIIRKEAKLLNIHVYDETAADKVLYNYYIVPFDAAGNAGTYSPEVKMYTVAENTIQPSVRRLRAVSDTARGAIKLSWSLLAGADVVSVNIYKGFMYDGMYGMLSSVSPSDTVYYDNDVVPVKTYYYTVVLNGAFETSPTSPRVSGMLEASWANNLPPQDFVVEANGNVVKLSWTRLEKDTRGYNIYRTVVGANNWIKVRSVLSADSAISAYDTLPVTKENLRYAYSITDINTSYNEGPPSNVESVGVAGTEILPEPASMSAIYSGKGKVMLIWSNTALLSGFVTGYNIYRVYLNDDGTIDGEWTKINSTAVNAESNIYYDQPTVFGRQIAYKVKSVGYDGAEGKFSPEARIVVQEEAKLNVSKSMLFISSAEVRIDWTAPLAEDLKNVEIWRAEKGAEAQLLYSAAAGVSTYSDKTIKSGKTYLYSIRCVYTDGTKSQFAEAGVAQP